jgi:hypothetical protein
VWRPLKDLLHRVQVEFDLATIGDCHTSALGFTADRRTRR